MTSTVTSVGGIVLCGGRSARMGQPKHLLPFGAETMLQRVIRTLSEVVSPIVVVAAPEQPLPQLGNDVIVAHDEQEGLGPLGGLSIGLSILRRTVEAAYVSSCDVPLLRPQFVEWMIESLQSHELAIARDGKYHHPLAAVYRTSLEDKVRELMAANRMRPIFLINECDSQIVEVEELREVDPELNSLRNINTPEDYQTALSVAGLDPRTLQEATDHSLIQNAETNRRNK